VEVSSEFKPIPDSAFETKTISTDAPAYTGKRISLNLVDADIKQVFRLFHEISGLNFVLDPGVEGRVTIVLDNVPWDQALDIILKNNSLDKLLENNVVRIASTQKLASEAASRKTLKEAKELEVEPTTVTRTLSYAKAKDVERVIRDGGILSPRGRVIVDERTNTLIVSDIPKKVEPLDKLVSSLDAETPQVMIEARIVETSKEFVQDFGVVWGMNAIADASRGTSTNANFPHNASLKYGLNLPGDGRSALALKLGNILDSFTLDVTLNALEQEGKTRILSAPKIATQNNERAEIEQGVRIPIVNTTATEINVEFVSASLKLSVTPQITAEGTIILDVSVENNSPDFVNKSGDTPSIKTQRAQTKILIADGGTTVIGGIFAVNESRSENGVPWFRKIPGLGWLFKSRRLCRDYEVRLDHSEAMIRICMIRITVRRLAAI
jgi:type IV pilus assembly protein PilQ